MTKETAIALFAHLESATFPMENMGAPEDQWADENTPPTDDWPTYDVRFDARITRDEEREYRLRVVVGTLVPSAADAVAAVMERAKDAGVEVVIQNSGIELS